MERGEITCRELLSWMKISEGVWEGEKRKKWEEKVPDRNIWTMATKKIENCESLKQYLKSGQKREKKLHLWLKLTRNERDGEIIEVVDQRVTCDEVELFQKQLKLGKATALEEEATECLRSGGYGCDECLIRMYYVFLRDRGLWKSTGEDGDVLSVRANLVLCSLAEQTNSRAVCPSTQGTHSIEWLRAGFSVFFFLLLVSMLLCMPFSNFSPFLQQETHYWEISMQRSQGFSSLCNKCSSKVFFFFIERNSTVTSPWTVS